MKAQMLQNHCACVANKRARARIAPEARPTKCSTQYSFFTAAGQLDCQNRAETIENAMNFGMGSPKCSETISRLAYSGLIFVALAGQAVNNATFIERFAKFA